MNRSEAKRLCIQDCETIKILLNDQDDYRKEIKRIKSHASCVLRQKKKAHRDCNKRLTIAVDALKIMCGYNYVDGNDLEQLIACLDLVGETLEKIGESE